MERVDLTGGPYDGYFIDCNFALFGTQWLGTEAHPLAVEVGFDPSVVDMGTAPTLCMIVEPNEIIEVDGPLGPSTYLHADSTGCWHHMPFEWLDP